VTVWVEVDVMETSVVLVVSLVGGASGLEELFEPFAVTVMVIGR
jgi:hypothetical protein